jgi:RNA polymerase sigma-70 factor (ECF subfamily)
VRMDQTATPDAARLSADAERALVERYVRAWEQSDVQAFVSLLKDDAVLSMPPLAEWYVGRAAIGDFFKWASGPTGGGPFRLVPTRANGTVGFGIYSASGQAVILHVLLLDRDGVAAMTSFMNPGLFAAFGLPASI